MKDKKPKRATKSATKNATKRAPRGTGKAAAAAGKGRAKPGSRGATAKKGTAVAVFRKDANKRKKPAARKSRQPGKRSVGSGRPMHVKLLPAERSAVASNPAEEMRVFQIYYDANQLPHLDPAFERFDNSGDAHPLVEFNVFCKIAARMKVDGTGLWGALSWKFQQKSGLTGVQLLRTIEKNPGFDVYYCNPFPEFESVYQNLWIQGETSHPNFLLLCAEFMQAADLPVQALYEILPSRAFASCHYVVATPEFWERYLAFVNGALARAESRLSGTARKMLYSSASDQKGLHAGVSYMPHIIERMFTLFLTLHGQDFRCYKYGVRTPQAQNAHLQRLREMKDVAHRIRSEWMASCWQNYRNLYLLATHDQAWVRKYLGSISPGKILFSRFSSEPAPQKALP